MRKSYVKIGAALLFVSSLVTIQPTMADTTTSTTSVLTTQERCTWYVDDIPGTVSLANADPTLKYEGVDYEVESNPAATVKVYVSGNGGEGTFESNTECTWYKTSEIDGIQLDLSVAADEVVSSRGGTPDNSLGFDLADSPYNITHTRGTCENKADALTTAWQTSDQTLFNTSINTSLATLPQADTSKVLAAGASPSDRCELDLTYSLTVPGDNIPAVPGANYTFTLPTVTWTVTTLPIP